ncbi:uncharacterized protein JCM15063_004643 [Sporobolomyces koalae]|uniref:uncharacterized protein n=1 Tax=Sporobolomyces koalae TaxID=500713 RepID=UPI00317376BC
MSKVPQTILSASATPVPSLDSISLLPCSLAFDGPAPISTYFHPRPFIPEAETVSPSLGSSSSSPNNDQHRQAAFRGRRLISSYFHVPRGYQGLVFSTQAATPPISTEDELQEELEEVEQRARQARQDRANKRAKLASTNGDEVQVRTSPRKAAKEARERAIRAAKGKGKASTTGFSLDDEDDDEGDDTEMEPEAGGEGVENGREDLVESVAEDKVDLTNGVSVNHVQAQAELEPSPEIPAPLPLLSRTSTSTSTQIDLPPTPSLPIGEGSQEEAPSYPVMLARDEKHLNPSYTFKSIEVWNPDFMVPGGRVHEEDPVARGVQEWIGLSYKIHAY